MALIEHLPGMAPGTGHLFNGELRGDAVTRSEIEEVAGAAGQAVEFSIEKVESTDELQEKLDVGVSVKASFGIFSGSARASFSEQASLTRTSIYLLASVIVTNSFRQMRDIKLKPEAVDLLKNGQHARFRERYGDVFIRGIATGGVFFSVLEITTEDEEQQSDISAEIEASGLGGAWRASAQFNKSIEAVSKSFFLKVRSFQQGGKSSNLPTDPDEIMDKAEHFPSEVAGNNAFPYQALSLSYLTTDNFPEGPNWLDMENAKDNLRELLRRRNRIRDLLTSINEVRENQHKFVNPNLKELNDAAEVLTGALDTVMRAASITINQPAESELPHIDFPPIVLPHRKPKGKKRTFNQNLAAAVAAIAAREQKEKQNIAEGAAAAVRARQAQEQSNEQKMPQKFRFLQEATKTITEK